VKTPFVHAAFWCATAVDAVAGCLSAGWARIALKQRAAARRALAQQKTRRSELQRADRLALKARP